MSDIVERLETFSDAHSWAVRGDAADEIKRLRAEIDRLRAALRDMLELHGKPRREGWLNNTTFELAKVVHERALEILARPKQP